MLFLFKSLNYLCVEIKTINFMNIAEILKDCPKGIKLYSPIFGNVYLDRIRPHLAIVVTTNKEQGDFKEEFLYDGRYGMNGECLLFPSKENRDWSTFQRPFKDGDIFITNLGSIFILKTPNIDDLYYGCYVALNDVDRLVINNTNFCVRNNIRFATEEEKQKLFDAIKANGYKWNEETKTLEKLIVPKFKVGDIIKHKSLGDTYTIESIDDNIYGLTNGSRLQIRLQDIYELAPNKFDISTLKPFTEVLIRDKNDETWGINLFGYYSKNNNTYYCMGNTNIGWIECIPYEGNEHLLGTTDDCDKYYKTW